MKQLSLLFAVFIDRLNLAIALVIFPSMFLDESYSRLLVEVPTNIKPILLGITLSATLLVNVDHYRYACWWIFDVAEHCVPLYFREHFSANQLGVAYVF